MARTLTFEPRLMVVRSREVELGSARTLRSISITVPNTMVP